MIESTFIEHCDGYRIEVDIPEGFTFKEGTRDSGCVIEDCLGNQYVRIPTGFTTNGMYVRGFWFSRYQISKGKDGKPQSVAGEYPWADNSFEEAERIAEMLGGSIPTPEEYNRICMWLVETGAATFEEVFIRGNGRGNYSNSLKLEKTGSNPKWMCNHIDNFWGNGYTFTTERSELYSHNRVVRGGYMINIYTGDCYPPSSRHWIRPNEKLSNVTIRVVHRDSRDNDDD